MNVIRPLACVALSLLLVATCAAAQDAGSAAPSDAPSVKSIVDQLKVQKGDSVISAGATRSLRLGGAAAAGKVADAPAAPPDQKSVV